MQGVPTETGGEREAPAAVRIAALHTRQIRLDLLGLVVKIDGTAVMVDAEAGAGRPLGNVAGESARLLGRLDLAPAIDAFAAEAGGTIRSFARLASGNKLLQGAEVGRVLAGMAGRRVKAGLRHVGLRRGDQPANAPA